MDGRKVVGGVLILVGIASVFYGINELNSFSSKLMNLVGQSNTGAYTAIVAGIIAGLVGLVLLFPKKSAA